MSCCNYHLEEDARIDLPYFDIAAYPHVTFQPSVQNTFNQCNIMKANVIKFKIHIALPHINFVPLALSNDILLLCQIYDFLILHNLCLYLCIAAMATGPTDPSSGVSGAADPVAGNTQPGHNEAVEAPNSTPFLNKPERMEVFIDKPSQLSLFNTCSIMIHGNTDILTPEENLVSDSVSLLPVVILAMSLHELNSHELINAYTTH